MRKITVKEIQKDGSTKRQAVDIRNLLNLNYLELSNKTTSDNVLGYPDIYCTTKILPDYLALYNQPSYYHKTQLTGVCFYEFDKEFDGIKGLFNAIYYKDKKLLHFYKERFKNVKFFISPDYSQFGDLQPVENMIRLWKARIVTEWFITELHAIAIPNMTYVSEETLPLFIMGLSSCSVVAFSTKGHVRYARERKLLKAAVKYCVDNLPLKTIVVYSVCGNDSTSLRLFQYAIDKGIRVVIPENSLRQRNQKRSELAA
jgi:hypothetical protein